MLFTDEKWATTNAHGLPTEWVDQDAQGDDGASPAAAGDHGVEDRFCFVEGILSSADHAAERAGFGGTRSAANRCVEIRDSRGSEAIRYAHGGGLIDRRKIDAQKIVLGACGNGLGSQKQQFRIFRRYAATAQRIDMTEEISQVLDANCAFAGENGALSGIAAENRDGMPRAEQATHDWRSHVSKTDESYAQSCVSP